MSETPKPPRKRGRFWLNVGEATAVVAVLIAGLNYWDNHRDHSQTVRDTAAQARRRAVLVLKGAADATGRRIALTPVSPSQVIESQRYYFPHAILGHAMEVSAASPQIDAAWIEAGLDRALSARRAKGAGEALLPVAITTTFVEDGDTRTDRSLYEIGYAWRSRLLLGREIRLQGVSLVRRGLAGDPQAAAERRWAAHAAGGGPM